MVKLCTENRIHDMMNKSTTGNLKTTKNFLHKITSPDDIPFVGLKQLLTETPRFICSCKITRYQTIKVKNKVNKVELKTTSKVVYIHLKHKATKVKT